MASKNTTPRAGATSAGGPTQPRRSANPTTTGGRDGKPKKRRWYQNLADGYRMTARIVPDTKLWVWLPALAVLAVFVVLAIVTGRWIFYPLTGLMLAVLIAMAMLSWKANQARYKQIDGELGAVGALLDQGRRGWTASSMPVHANPRTRDLVYRAVGKPGVVLISEGPENRVRRLLDEEARRVTRVMPEVPVHRLQIGHGSSQTHISKMWSAMGAFPGKLTPSEVSTIAKRLSSMDQRRAPIPKGVDPAKARVSRRAMRGR